MKGYTSNPPQSMLIISIGFFLLYCFGINKGFNANWALWTAITISFIGLFIPFLSEKVEWLWMKLALILSYVFPPILLGLVYFIVLSPVALIQRLLGKQNELQLKDSKLSTWISVEKTFTAESLENPW